MAVRTEDIRAIQVELSARNPVPVAQDTLTAVNGDPNDAATPADEGVSVKGASGRSTVYTRISVEKGASVTSYDIRWWGYAAGRGRWGLLPNSASSGLDTDYLEFIPTGPIDRLYCELTAITDSGAGDGVVPVIAPCDTASE